ncbi:MAG: nitroreductase family protein [Candidatus Amulumruptor caecigallinarius]|nr:nitroreductase family protein [Candidatus Amulumruptor caecigallinarius]
MFKERRTIRKYTDQEISESQLSDILESAMRAPTCGNMQLYSVVVTRSEEGKRRLAPAHFNQPMITEAPVVLTICADYNRFSQWCRLSNANPGYDNFLSFITAMSDATIFAQQIVAIAESRGLGTCYLGTVTYNADMISEILGLPELCVPVACITLGWPADAGDAVERLPLHAIMHDETYRHDTDGDIKEQFRAKDEYGPNLKYIEENGKQTLAQVFTDIRYTREMNEEFSKRFLQLLRNKNFM